MSKKKSKKSDPKPAEKSDPKEQKKLSAADKARATMGLPPREHKKKDKPKREPGEVTKRKAKYNVKFDSKEDSPGWASLPVIHWLGQEGFDLAQARKVLNKYAPGSEAITDENLAYRLGVGRAGKRSRPAPLSAEEAQKCRKAAGIK